MATYKRMLLAHDGSTLADVTLAHAAAFAIAGGGSIVVLGVVDVANTSLALRSGDWDGLVQRSEADLGDASPPLGDAVAALHKLGVPNVGSLLVGGDPGEAIVQAAAALDCDLIVIASHGRSGFRRAILGSVSDYVVPEQLGGGARVSDRSRARSVTVSSRITEPAGYLACPKEGRRAAMPFFGTVRTWGTRPQPGVGAPRAARLDQPS